MDNIIYLTVCLSFIINFSDSQPFVNYKELNHQFNGLQDSLPESSIKIDTLSLKTKGIRKYLEFYEEKGGINPPKDSLINWINDYKRTSIILAPKFSDKTQVIQIDTMTNEIINTSIIKYKGVHDYEKIEKVEKLKYDNILPIISKNWLPDNDSFSSVEFPELRSLKNRTGFYDASNNFLIVVETEHHGGAFSKIYFFNKDGVLLNIMEYEKGILSPIFGFNNEKTFFYIASLVSPEIFIYKPDGTIFLSGDYHSITGDKGTSYGQPIISKSGRYIILKNNFAWIFEDKILLSKIKYSGVSVINEELELIAYEYQNILYISDIKENLVKYFFPSDKNLLIKVQPFNKIVITKYKNRKNRLSYEVFGSVP
jgi:hypothetical protein